MMRILLSAAPALVLLAGPVTTTPARSEHTDWTDWGGGYLRRPDSASTTVATSGGGSAKQAPANAPAPVGVTMTDWGAGYRRGADSASTTVATSGAGTPKPND